ncbi:MAG: AraC family transcriptional regulator, partial [Duncaniella sp.]|nr:AraC family transcriptional regulator [Duncaniella sp.]
AETNQYSKVSFTGITLLYGDSVVTKPLSHTDTLITLSPSTRDISLRISSLHYGNLDGVKYYWRINEEDTLWTQTDGVNGILLTGLTPGKKTVEVCSTDSYGRILNNTGVIKLTVMPHWYELRWVRMAIWICGIMVLGVSVYLFISNRRLRKIYDSVINSQPVAVVAAAMTEIKPEESLTQADRDFINALNAGIEEKVGDSDFSIDAVVTSLGMSRSVFYRRLKTIVGQSPSEYINKYRLKRAAEMLRESPDRPVSSIAYDCGFSSPQYFSNLFRKEYHMTPNEWRKNVV